MSRALLNGDLRPLLDRPALKKVFGALDGVEARVIGGAVRNALLGERIADIDLAVAAPPEVVIAKSERAGIRAVPTGIEHGTVTLVLDGAHFEVTSLREDVETDGRRAKVRFGEDFAADAQRRDFTINALSVDVQGRIYDYVGGLDDLAQRRVRFIGDPRQRIMEDYLRILRFFRFSACYGEGPLDAEGFAACIALRGGVAQLSRERLGGEMLKVLSFPRSAAVIEAMSQAGLLAFLHVAPWPARNRRLAAILSAQNLSDPLVSLAALAVHSASDAERLSEALRLSRAERRRLAEMAAAAAAWHGATQAPSPAQLREQLFLRGAQAARDALLLIQAEGPAGPNDQDFLAAQAFLRDTPAPKAPFAAADLLARGVRQGAGLGAALKRLQAAWIRAGFPQDPKRIAALMDAACAQGPQESSLHESGWTRNRR
ncbi:CCA tRNA nucleotidyltransferase [Rhodoblastus sp.]|uniref:CCA tRNA nucleotidyltransferase n=1 Tax=Rhodoblastus sp. TaxID=1962975 RepID=UPI00261AB97E|nr:CCA tRNA nucleotidyltransferase [Rhodoblastus sp.]